MYLRITRRHNRDGSAVEYYALAENVWNAEAKRSDARVIHSFGRADQIDRAALERLIQSINRVLGNETGAVANAKTRAMEIKIEHVYDLGVVLAARSIARQTG